MNEDDDDFASYIPAHLRDPMEHRESQISKPAKINTPLAKELAILNELDELIFETISIQSAKLQTSERSINDGHLAENPDIAEMETSIESRPDSDMGATPKTLNSRSPEFFDMIREKSAKMKANAQKNGHTAKAYDEIDSYRKAHPEKYAEKRREDYAEKIQENEGRNVRDYNKATQATRKEQNRNAKSNSRAKMSDEEKEAAKLKNAERMKMVRAAEKVAAHLIGDQSPKD